MCLLTHKSLLSGELRHIQISLELNPISSLRSSTASGLVEPFLSGQMTTKRSFSHRASRVYSQPPSELRASGDMSIRENKLKSYSLETSHDMENLVIKPDYKVKFYVQLALFSLLVDDFLRKISRKNQFSP